MPAQIAVRQPKSDPLYAHEERDTSAQDMRYISSDHIVFLPGIKIKKRSYAKRNMWGFYDGEHVYINAKNYAPSVIARYSRILHFGRYCYFYGAEDIHKKTTGLIGGGLGAVPIGHYYLLDMRSGKVLKVDNTTVTSIVAEFPDLHRRFEASKKSTAQLLTFIEEYNRLYSNQ